MQNDLKKYIALTNSPIGTVFPSYRYEGNTVPPRKSDFMYYWVLKKAISHTLKKIMTHDDAKKS